jgi:hypothetical protein
MKGGATTTGFDVEHRRTQQVQGSGPATESPGSEP